MLRQKKVAELEHKYANIKHLVRGRKEPQKPSKSARMEAEQMLCLRTHYYGDESVVVAWVCVWSEWVLVRVVETGRLQSVIWRAVLNKVS